MSDYSYAFLNEPKNMHAREAILMHRLFLDTKLAAARRSYYLNTYFDDVDHDGFDVILDDQDSIKKIQVKSVGADNATRTWEIHKTILRPSLGMSDKLGFEASPEGIGVEGGVVLIEYTVEDGELLAKYYYTDVFILLAFELGLIVRRHKASSKTIQKCLLGLRKGLGNEGLSVPKAAFLAASGPDALLSLMGLHSQKGFEWKYTLVCLATQLIGDKSIELLAPETQLRSVFWQQFRELLDDKKLSGGTSSTVQTDGF